MKRSTRMLLGISIALITAASLHLTIGDRFHQRMHGHYRGFGCGNHWKSYQKEDLKKHTEPEEGSVENLNNNQ